METIKLIFTLVVGIPTIAFCLYMAVVDLIEALTFEGRDI